MDSQHSITQKYLMVIDTMVFAYALLGVSEFREESLAVLQSTLDVFVPDSFRAELVNTVWQWVGIRRFPFDAAVKVLGRADSLVTQVVPANVLWEQALSLAVSANHPAYDTLFVALAERQDTKVVTYDEGLRRAFPGQSVSPGEFLS